ncbi:MAG: saccharopine dehydrogenase NADP-binding domain-containing protein [Fimbriimonadaceae bacterium]|nr:saccharopine dehydrogenase NADP-binding domain-containing protein [Fimbriimonadaceae bacterium]QYK56689.1 MAG: saccharopine dehydrogenase NADP-binding domain-containing protein [Fimbriimonadaceae bacterium]
MQNSFAILGSGMQGTAAAYDLAKFAAPARIFVGDVDPAQAKACADRVNGLVGDLVCEAVTVDAMDRANLSDFLDRTDIVLSCLPYWMHPLVAEVAIETMTDMVDLGGNTDVTMKTLDLNDRAVEAGVTLVPDAGLAPGLVNNIGFYIVESLDECDTVKLYCGVLPQNPKPPFNYKLTFNVEGLVTEYDYQAVALRENEIIKIDTLSEVEDLYIDQLGEMEAFVTSGGTSTAPYTLHGQVRNYEYKTIRHPGHAQLMRLFKDFGFWNEGQVDVKGTKIVPKDVFNAVFGPELAKFEDKDLCAVRGIGWGTRGGKPTTVQIDIFDRQCETTGFTSMERLTGFSMAIIAQEVVQGGVAKGAVRYEKAMTGQAFMHEFLRRDFNVKIRETVEIA